MEKKMFFLLFFLQIILQISFANSKDLDKADSLFVEKKYTQALEIYENIFEKKYFTPQMLLKMSFIFQGIGDDVNTLYFLSFFDKYYPNRIIEQKIQNIAESKNLKGYQMTDFEYFKTIYSTYKNVIKIILYLTVSILLLFILFQKIVKKKVIFLQVLSFIFVILIFLVEKELFHTSDAIISVQGSLLMDAPSAGASLIEKVDKGHKIKIYSYQDIWCEIEWENKRCFIRKHNLLFL